MTISKPRHLALAFCLGVAAPGLASAHEPASPDPRGETLHHVAIGTPGDVPLVAVNGGPGFDHSYLVNAPVWKDMSARRQIIFYDQRGTGKSPAARGPADMTVDGMVRDLEALRRHLKVERIDLLGHSWGGILSMAYATRYPQHVAHLVLVGSGAPKPAEHEFLFDKLYPEVVAAIPPDTSPAGQMGCIEIDAYDKMSYYDQRNLAAGGGDDGTFSQTVCTEVMLDAMKLDLYPALAKLDVPTLVINGRFDANVAPTVAYKISKTIPGARLVYFERSGHSPQVEEPDKFALEVERFLGGSVRK